MIWMLGGRSGSTILHHNEVLMYPGTYSATQHKMWAWMNKVRKNILKIGKIILAAKAAQ